MTLWKVTQENAGQRLPNFIQSRLSESISLKQLKSMIENKSCQVNGRLETFASYLVKEGDSIDFIEKKASSIEILYEDPFLLVINKPPFIVCEAEKGLLGHKLVHRLDKETSGCLILAKTDKAEQALMDLFKAREVKKEYLAVVDGLVKQNSGVIETPVNGKESKTVWRVEKKGKNSSLIRCFPETGRTHQLRIHLNSKGYPILGDVLYSKIFKSPFLPSRILLHAASLSFIHPFKRIPIHVSVPAPQEFYEALNH